MKAIEAIEERIKNLYMQGKTDSQLARMAECSTTHMNNLRNGKREISGISVDFLLKLFPDLDKAIADACRGVSGNANIIQGDGNTGVTQTICCGDLDAYQLRLYQGLASLDIPDDAKAKVLALIKSAAKGE